MSTETHPHPSIALLEEAALIASQEKEALLDEDGTRLESLIKKREYLMDTAWDNRAGCDPELLLRHLTALAATMEQLARQCQCEHDSIRAKLAARKQHRHYTSAPRARMIGDNKRLLFDRPL